MTHAPLLRTCTAAALLAATLPATAQGPAAPGTSVDRTDPCRTEVLRFERAIGFIRQAQGVDAAADLKEKLLPAKLENEILFKDGYCGLAKYLKDRKLDR
jgi:hypothetical protein